MNVYRVSITMPDGSRGVCHSLFENACDAILQALQDFPDARGVSAFFIKKGGAV